MITANLLIQTRVGAGQRVAEGIRTIDLISVDNVDGDRITAVWRGQSTQELIDLTELLCSQYPEITRVEPTTLESDL